VKAATDYPWCSAGWFELRANPATVRMVQSFKIDRVNVQDEYEVELGG